MLRSEYSAKILLKVAYPAEDCLPCRARVPGQDFAYPAMTLPTLLKLPILLDSAYTARFNLLG